MPCYICEPPRAVLTVCRFPCNTLDTAIAGSSLEEYRYNGLDWRILKRADTDTTAGLDEERVMVYSASWQLLEERVDDDYGSSPGMNHRVQHLWGLRYIDDIVLHRKDVNNDGDYVDTGLREGTWYHLTDAQFSTVCITDAAAAVEERVSYDAYGEARHHWFGDVNGDGAITLTGAGSDKQIIIDIYSGMSPNNTIDKWDPNTYTNPYRAEADLDRDGDVDATDAAFLTTAKSAKAKGVLSDAAGPDNVIGWDGYVYNAEIAMYTVRFRTYSPQLGRWVERDPVAYVDSMNLYAAVRSSPIGSVDPSGQFSIIEFLHGYGGVSGTLPPIIIPLGPSGCAINIVVTGSIEARSCVDPTTRREHATVCFVIDVEGFISCGKSTPGRRRDVKAPPTFERVPGDPGKGRPGGLIIPKDNRNANPNDVRFPSGYRERKGYIGAGTSCQRCPDGCDMAANGSMFLRGSVGVWVGVQGEVAWDITDLFSGDLDALFDWDKISGSWGGAYGVYGASIEFGLRGHFDGCCTGPAL